MKEYSLYIKSKKLNLLKILVVILFIKQCIKIHDNQLAISFAVPCFSLRYLKKSKGLFTNEVDMS